MAGYEEELKNARKYISLADYLLTQTLPFIGEPKLLFVVVENVFLGFSHSIRAVLEYEKEKNSLEFGAEFEDYFNVFKMKVAQRYGIQPEVIKTIYDLKAIVNAHKKSPVEFVRKDRFMICSRDYGHIDVLSLKEAQAYLNRAKLFACFVENRLGIKKH